MNTSELAKLSSCIEENLRASPVSGLPFVDSRHHRERLLSKQNHVVFGRRGAGKTSLIKSVSQGEDIINVYLNLDDYKDITFPNILIYVLIQVFSELERRIADWYPWYKRWKSPHRELVSQLNVTISRLRELLYEPDEETQEISEKDARQREGGAGVEGHGLSASGKISDSQEREVKRQLPKRKIDYLRIELTNYKQLITDVSHALADKPIFLLIDDFYFTTKETQPDFVDYFHRLTKGTNLFLKIATIKHRSKLYRRREGQYIGVELSHDIFELDMDYALDNIEELQSFMRQLLNNAIEVASADITVDELFAGDGFLQLCLASGGVPRDFLSLFANLANSGLNSGLAIGKIQVNEAAISNVGTKYESMKKDSGDEDSVLLDCLVHIKRFVYSTKRTNAFLVAKDDLENDLQGKQAIRELVDLRLIHLVDDNISKAPSDGRRYEAYMLDIGLYENSRPRSFKQVDPGQRDEKARKDNLRASPVFQLSMLNEPLNEQSTPTKPQVSVEPDIRHSGQVTQLALELSFE